MSETHSITLTVNGNSHKLDVRAGALLVDVLRRELRLTGTHLGCDTSQCGACVVHLDGKPVKACTLLAVQADGADVTTIEGLAKNGNLHPMQEAFSRKHGLQCGFCTPGMIMTAVDIVARHGVPDEATVARELDGNMCRCTGYRMIIDSVIDGAKVMAGEGR